MKNVLIKELWREIRRTKTRFLSILAIIAVGTGFFAGVKSSCPDMKETAYKYFSGNRLMDIRLLSTLGFTEADLSAIQQVDGIRGMMPAYSVDSFVFSADGSNLILKTISVKTDADTADENYINRPVLVEGRLPEKSGECLVENTPLAANFPIGSEITLFFEEGEEVGDKLKTDTFTVVGIANSPAYISFERGNSQIGDGSVDGYVMIPEKDFTLSVYTDVYLTLEGSQDISPYLREYEQLIDKKTVALEKVADTRSEERYQEILDEAQDELDKAKTEFADGEKKATAELDKAKKELDDAKKQLEQGQKEYEDGLKQYEDGLVVFEREKLAALEQIAEHEKQAKALAAQLAEGEATLAGAKQTIAGIVAVREGYRSLSIPDPTAFPDELQQMIAAAKLLEEAQPADTSTDAMTLDQLLSLYVQTDGTTDTTQKELLGTGIDQAISAIEAALAVQEASLIEGKAGLNALQDGIVSGREKLAETEQALAESKKMLDDVKKELENGKAEYEKGVVEYNDGKKTAEKELADGRQKLADAEKQLAELSSPTWYIWNRDSNPGYTGYQQDAEKVDAIAQVFPVFFVLVAALVCLTTMTRLVEEERTQIGTLKALGYHRTAIMMKYLLYAALASLAGSVIGLTIGFQLFPRVIMSAYDIMYNMPDPITPFRWNYAIACTVVAVLCTGLSALAACYKALRACPAQLMRPRAPKNGKRILLEHIPFIWDKLGFIHKVTLRNIFRYKQRALMTILGVAGCTALLLTGFGLKYSITSIAEKQYSNVFIYDAIAAGETIEDTEKLQGVIDEGGEVSDSLMLLSKDIELEGKNGSVKSASLYVPQTASVLSNYISLHERSNEKGISLDDDGVILTEKLANNLGVKQGDVVMIDGPDRQTIEVTVTAVTENYIMHFVYMSPQLYEVCFRETPGYNTVLLNFKEEGDKSALSERLLKDGTILGVSYADEGARQFVDMMGSLNSIVWVLIISAGALAFIVMYNLVNINVNERVRELASIKVLGFYDKEVSAYIYRENNIAAGLGMLFGLVLGVFLERFVIMTAEVDIVMFSPEISLPCFIYSALLTILFTAIVTITLYFQLKKISMVESLKSVE